MYKRKSTTSSSEAGFSIVELIIAMSIALVAMALGSSLLASSFNVGRREDRRSQALADTQRALNLMTREVANSGYKLPPDLTYTTAAGTQAAVPSNGIIPVNSGTNAIRIVANLSNTSNSTTDPVVGSGQENEDVRFSTATASGVTSLLRHDNNATSTKTTVLADSIESLVIRYYDERVTYTASGGDISNVRNAAGNTEAEVTPAAARYVVIVVNVLLPAVGTPGADSYQPPTRVQLTSDVALRNARLIEY